MSAIEGTDTQALLDELERRGVLHVQTRWDRQYIQTPDDLLRPGRGTLVRTIITRWYEGETREVVGGE